ncbi:HOMEODOMAIN-LIKE SUPERFAMILY PROTEIN [Salix purpurea]|uniref:HOMEODOMAIN-LIKE SUPERFAMILY PROTEIN n=1 Tax=Salix purpurea TaxID=77065 RepID=A0A9Q0UT08_SALPP|nr:HOMEODOMAIN-LIKE SUPERFAMILY PROTEIN [Salix purpurea]
MDLAVNSSFTLSPVLADSAMRATPSEISYKQRWAIIRKQRGNSNAGTISSGSQLSEAQRAACHAVKMALDSHPAAKSSVAYCSGGIASNKSPNNCMLPAITMEASLIQHQSQQHPMMSTSSSTWPLRSTEKSQVMLTKTSAKSISSSDPVRAAAVAAGASIATQSDAALMLKAAHAKNAVHIMPTGNSSIKSSMDGGVSTQPEGTPNIRLISCGMATAPAASHPAASGPFLGLAKATSPSQVKASSSIAQHTQSVTSWSTLSEQTTNAEIPPKQNIEVSEQVLEAKAALTNQERSESQVVVAESCDASRKWTMNESDLAEFVGKHVEGSQNADDNKVTCTHIKETENKSAVQENGKNPSASKKQADLPSMLTNESCKK